MEGQEKVKKRTRDGCWTCRKRKKKCDGPGIPCGNCSRLSLACETSVRLVWEDDVRRIGMKRRGPTGNSKKDSLAGIQSGTAVSCFHANSAERLAAQNATSTNPRSDSPQKNSLQVSGPASNSNHILLPQQLSAAVYPRPLNATESLLLDHYIQRFSREYPTCPGPSNPFLSVFIPLAMKCNMVLDSLLALSGAQRWEHGVTSMEKAMLGLRQRALKAARDLLLTESQNPDKLPSTVVLTGDSNAEMVQRPGALLGTDSTGQENLLFILTSSVLFLLYEKVSGETSWKPHMEFINNCFECLLKSLAIDARKSPELAETVRFLHNVFVYNDLVRSTSTQSKPLSDFYITATKAIWGKCSPLEKAFFPSSEEEQAQFRVRYYFPHLIARLSSGDHTVTEDEIAEWNGSMDWLPSFALGRTIRDQSNVSNAHPSSTVPREDQVITSELYRTAARIYRRQVLDRRSGNGLTYNPIETNKNAQTLPRLAAYAQSLMVSLPPWSPYENALLWPIGIAAKELMITQVNERSNILLRLQHLEARFQMRHFQKVQDVLRRHWAQKDTGLDSVALTSEEDAILLG